MQHGLAGCSLLKCLLPLYQSELMAQKAIIPDRTGSRSIKLNPKLIGFRFRVQGSKVVKI